MVDHTRGSQHRQINGSFQIKEELVFLNSALSVKELQEKQASDKDEKINGFFVKPVIHHSTWLC